MKNTNKVAIATLAATCLVCGVVGLTACEPAVVSKISVGDNYIGTVTSEGKTFDVEGTVDTEYKLTATVGGETCNDILMTINGVPSNGWAIFTYAEDTTVTFKTVSDDVAKVTVVMEKYEPEGPGPSVTTYDLAADAPATVTDLKSGDNFSIKFNTQTGKTYTVTVSDENVKFANLTGGENESGPKSFNGAEFVDYDNVATISMTAEANVASVTISLSVADTVKPELPEIPNYATLSVGPNKIEDAEDDWSGVIYKLTVSDEGNYTFSGIESYNLSISTGVAYEDEAYVIDMSATLEPDESGNYTLLAGTTYYVGIYANGTLTISSASAATD